MAALRMILFVICCGFIAIIHVRMPGSQRWLNVPFCKKLASSSRLMCVFSNFWSDPRWLLSSHVCLISPLFCLFFRILLIFLRYLKKFPYNFAWHQLATDLIDSHLFKFWIRSKMATPQLILFVLFYGFVATFLPLSHKLLKIVFVLVHIMGVWGMPNPMVIFLMMSDSRWLTGGHFCYNFQSFCPYLLIYNK